MKELFEFIKDQTTETAISKFCTSKSIEWKFIPERSPHFGGLWEAAVKSMKFHLRRVISPEVKLTYEELSTVLSQIEACHNSRPLGTVQTPNDDTIEVLTPCHVLVGHSLMALPDRDNSKSSLPMLRRWHLCQNLTRHFWKKMVRRIYNGAKQTHQMVSQVKKCSSVIPICSRQNGHWLK